MRYVILRDDDTNALTPVDCLERLYRPFLDHGLPVNLAVIPNVATDTTQPDGKLEGFLFAKTGIKASTAQIGSNPQLTRYLLENPGFKWCSTGSVMITSSLIVFRLEKLWSGWSTGRGC